MLESFKQQDQMSVLELYIEKDVAGGSMFHSANSLTSCGNYLSNDETQPPTNMSNLHIDEDDDDDDYLVSNSYVEESFDEDDSVDGISDTDDEVTDMIQPVRIVHPAEGAQRIENPFWNDALHYNNINWSYPDEEDICGLEMSSTFNVGQELYVGMKFDSKDAVKNAVKQYVMKEHQSFKVVESKSNNRKHRQFHRVFWTFGQCKEAFKYCKPIILVVGTHLYGKYRGTLLMATSQDGNGGVLPLAFAVVEAIATWIDRISKEKWMMAYDREGRRYGHMTTNLSKCINKVLKDCRNIPITALVKSMYSRCRKYFVEHWQVYCSKLVKELRNNQEQACSHIVRVYDIHSTRFEVEETFNPITQCGRQKWAVNLNDVVYTNEHILKAYSAQWWPLGNEAAIPPSNDTWTLIPDPTTIRVKGRPKSTRIRNEMDWVEPSEHRQKCSRCGAEGNNRRRCPMQSERESCSNH
ncbi:hypothetical protein GmHk_04G011158 [Glycine max]|nr:hypothetical protein GmHk_04G011158 [Glycine max]